MNTIFAKNIWKENRAFTKKDLIHENFECDIFINENKLTDNMIIKKENNITYVFKKDYIDINKMFFDSDSDWQFVQLLVDAGFTTEEIVKFFHTVCHGYIEIKILKSHGRHLYLVTHFVKGCKSLFDTHVFKYKQEFLAAPSGHMTFALHVLREDTGYG